MSLAAAVQRDDLEKLRELLSSSTPLEAADVLELAAQLGHHYCILLETSVSFNLLLLSYWASGLR